MIVFGCGGIRLCMIDSLVIVGNVINKIFCFVVLWIEIINGNNIKIFILKNIGILIIKFVINIVYGKFFILKDLIKNFVICILVFDFVIIFFKIVFKIKIFIKCLRIFLIFVL